VPSADQRSICPEEPPDGICLLPDVVGCVYALAPVAIPFNLVLSDALIRPAEVVEAPLYVVFGGTVHVPSSLRYFVVPAVVDGAGTRPAFAPEPDLTKFVGRALLSALSSSAS